MKENIVFEKSKKFAIRIIKLYKYLNDNGEKVISGQLLRSVTSIGANIAEAECAVSKNEFISKMHISFKECNESDYWIDLLYKTEYLTKEQYDSIKADCLELKNCCLRLQNHRNNII